MTLRIEDLAVSFDDRTVLDGVSLAVESGSIVALLGPNGVGKSTLLRSVVDVLEPDRGRVTLDGRNLGGLSRRERAAELAYVPQSETPTFSSTVFQSVLLGRAPYTTWRPAAADRERVNRALSRLGLSSLSGRHLDELSEGQRQKVRIARVLVQEPTVLLLDEPTASLDLRHQQEVLGLLEEVVRTDDRAALVAMHDLELAARFADQVVLVSDGSIYATGDPIETLTEDVIETVYGVSATLERVESGLHLDAVSEGSE
ncbi:MAG: ABC transporter ATP-binding protein [Halodesulfurarchaeum sp.]